MPSTTMPILHYQPDLQIQRKAGCLDTTGFMAVQEIAKGCERLFNN